MVRVHRSNPGWLERLVRSYSGPEDQLAIGWPKGTASVGLAYPDGTQVAMVAAVNTYGSASRGIPARPFMALGGVMAVKETAPIAAALAPALNKGKVSRAQVLEHMGQPAADAFKEAITDGQWAPNAPATVAEKGSARPLVDTGLMRNSITYAVRKG